MIRNVSYKDWVHANMWYSNEEKRFIYAAEITLFIEQHEGWEKVLDTPSLLVLCKENENGRRYINFEKIENDQHRFHKS